MPRTPDVYRRTQAFNLYAKYRNVSRVGKETGIPIATLFVWKKQDKWDDKIVEVQTNLKEQLSRSEESNGDNNGTAYDELAKDIANEINSLALMDIKADAAIEDGYKTMTLVNVIKTKEFTSKQRRILLGQTKDEEFDSVQSLEKISMAEYRRLKEIMNRLDPGWENDKGESVNNDSSVAGNG